MANLILVAPLDGWSSALEEVPDPVFAGKVMGDGVAIDPTSTTLRAPCDGEIVTIAAARHAVVLRAENGAQILLHVGCNTVELGGTGFDVRVSAGQRVRTGDPLLDFDLDALAQRAQSLVTPIVLVENDAFDIVRREDRRAVRAGDFLMELQPIAVGSAASSSDGRGEARRNVRVPFEHGIHARPAALLAAALRGFSAEVVAVANGRKANARSAVAWMELGVRRDDEITVVASGRDAEAALNAIEKVLAAPPSAAPARPPLPSQSTAPSFAGESQPPSGKGIVRGVPASPGIAAGPAARIEIVVPPPSESGAGIAHETAELDRARTSVRADLQRVHDDSSGVAREVLEAHLAFVDDPELLRVAHESIAAGKSAGWAWREAVERTVSSLLAGGDSRMAERADDLRDVAGRVIAALAGNASSLEVPQGSILVGREVLLAHLAALPPGRIAGFCTAVGGPTSHVALLAASMNLPAIVAAGDEVMRIDAGTPLVLDATAGLLYVAPDAATQKRAEQMLARAHVDRDAAHASAATECHLASGERIEVFANVSAVADAELAVARGAEGCGVLRTEFLFFDRTTAPDTAQQRDAYQAIVSAFGGRPVIIRTLDAGSDKPLPYLPLPHGENPALGVRGVRASLWRPELLRDQLRAILAVEPHSACRIMLPMIADVSEVASVRLILDQVCRELGREAPPLGVMIETPAAALLADRLSRVADFLSIGSNDLAQYTLAMDRGQAELASQLDALHPAVLRLIQITATAGRAAGRIVAVCGGLASDPAAAPLLVGLGVNELSAVPSAVPAVKAALRATTLDSCRALAGRALAAASPAAVRALTREAGVNR